MPTKRQALGEFGEKWIVRECDCPRCKRQRTFVRLPTNFKCANVICDFCGYVAQVKTATVADTGEIPKIAPGAAWEPHKERMEAGIYFPLFLVLVTPNLKEVGVYYLPSDLQRPDFFVPRSPLTESAQRAGWQGFSYDLKAARKYLVRLS
jgi:type II restriction enzyme